MRSLVAVLLSIVFAASGALATFAFRTFVLAGGRTFLSAAPDLVGVLAQAVAKGVRGGQGRGEEGRGGQECGKGFHGGGVFLGCLLRRFSFELRFALH